MSDDRRDATDLLDALERVLDELGWSILDQRPLTAEELELLERVHLALMDARWPGARLEPAP